MRMGRSKTVLGLRERVNSRLVGWSQQVDATPSDVRLLCKRWCAMRPGQRFGLSAIEKNEIWRRWKAGQTLHEIGRAFDKPHSSIRCLLFVFVLATSGGADV